MTATKGKGGRFWIGLVLTLLGANMALVAVTVYAAQSSRSPILDQHEAARHWQITDEQERLNASLGWQVRATIRDVGGARTLRLKLTDGAGKAIAHADMSAEVMGGTMRRIERVSPIHASDGTYTASLSRDLPQPLRVSVIVEATGVRWASVLQAGAEQQDGAAP